MNLLMDMFHVSVSKTNLAVHEDKNRVPFVKVSKYLLHEESFMSTYTYCSITVSTAVSVL